MTFHQGTEEYIMSFRIGIRMRESKDGNWWEARPNGKFYINGQKVSRKQFYKRLK